MFTTCSIMIGTETALLRQVCPRVASVCGCGMVIQPFQNFQAAAGAACAGVFLCLVMQCSESAAVATWQEFRLCKVRHVLLYLRQCQLIREPATIRTARGKGNASTSPSTRKVAGSLQIAVMESMKDAYVATSCRIFWSAEVRALRCSQHSFCACAAPLPPFKF